MLCTQVGEYFLWRPIMCLNKIFNVFQCNCDIFSVIFYSNYISVLYISCIV